jgi:catecholate siderophore receptor
VNRYSRPARPAGRAMPPVCPLLPKPGFARAPLAAAVVAALLGAGGIARADEEKTLPTVHVTAGAGQQEGFLATRTRIGRVAQDPQDLPQAVTIVTRSLIEEQDANSLREALRNVAGITFNAAEGGRSGDNMMLRGFYTFGDIYLDGIRDTAQYNRETFNLEQVEVLRGSASMLFGRGQAGGVINQVSKVPMLYGINRVEAGIGSYGYGELKADLNQRFGETSALRINLMGREEGSARSNPVTGTEPEIKRFGVAPSISFGLGTAHEFTLSYYYLKTNDIADYGVPFVNRRPQENAARDGRYWGIASNFDDSETNIATANYVFRIDPDTSWRTALRAANYQRAYWAAAPSATRAPTTTVTQQMSKTRSFDTDNFVLQSDFNTAFTVFGMRNELVTGVEYLYEDSERWGLRNLGTANDARYSPSQVFGKPSSYSGDTYSAYLQDTLEFVKDWRLTAGIRRDLMKSDYVSATGDPQTISKFDGDFGENSYRAALSWQPSAAQHYYLAWSDSFSPTADLYQLTGSQYPAERAEVTELGAKWLLLDGSLAFRTAIYHAVKDWERNTDLEADSSNSILTRKRESDGLEFELAGRITDAWDVFGGLSFIDAEILEVRPGASLVYLGQLPRNTPRRTANLWTTYKLGGGWKVGGGLDYKSERLGYSPTSATATAFTPNMIPSYTRWDAMVAYEQPKYAFRLNVQNIFDKVYYDAFYDNGGFSLPGQARRVILNGEYRF